MQIFMLTNYSRQPKHRFDGRIMIGRAAPLVYQDCSTGVLCMHEALCVSPTPPAYAIAILTPRSNFELMSKEFLQLRLYMVIFRAF